MATIRLNDNETLGFTLSGGDNLVFGQADGEETVSVSGGTQTFDSSFNTGGDTVIFDGLSSSYSISRSGSSIIVTGPNNTVVTFPAPSSSLDDADRPTFVFDDGSFALDTTVVDGAATVTIGDQEITDTPTEIGGGTPGTPSGIVLNVEATDVIEGTDDITYTFTLSEASDEAITINVTTIGGTATSGSDYTAVNQTITFAAGQTVATLVVDVLDDADMNEGDETVIIDVDSNGVLELDADADLTATITDNDQDLPQSFQLTTGGDTVLGGSGADRINGVQNVFEPGKLLSQVDLVNGGDGVDTLVLINASGGSPNVVDDVDFTQVSSVEVLSSNYNQITLGAEAAEAGLVRVDTTPGDTQVVGGGTLLDISSAAFTNELTVAMSNSFADRVITNLANGADAINTGTNTLNPDGSVAVAPIDEITLIGQTAPVRITFTSSAAGNGNAFDTGGNLALTAQSEDDVDGLVGSITRFDDEGIRFSGGAYDVRDISGTQRGTFAEVVVGTLADDVFFAGSAGAYLNAGMGDDVLIGSSAVDFLVGGAGDDYLEAGAGNDSILGGGGDDILDGGAGRDTMDGGEGSDTYVFDAGEFTTAETITDTGTGVDDIDTLDITSSTVIGANAFEGKVGFEQLFTDVTAGTSGDGVAEVTLGEGADMAGIRTVRTDDDDIDAGDYVSDLLVFTGSGGVITGAGDDEVRIAQSPLFTVINNGPIALGDGDDILNTYYNSDYSVADFDGGDGNDSLLVGGAYSIHTVGVFAGEPGDNVGNGEVPYDVLLGDGVVGFETIVFNAAEADVAVEDADDIAGNTIAFNASVDDDNVEADTTLTVDASGLTAGVVTDLGADNEIGGSGANADGETDNTLAFDGSALSGDRTVVITGGAGDDVLITGAGNDTLVGGEGDDYLEGGLGVDNSDGGEGSDIYYYNGVRFNSADIVNDTGSEGTDTIVVESSTAVVDGNFINKVGVEELMTNITSGAVADGVAEVTLGENAEAAGIRTVRTSNDDIDASDYESDLLVFTGNGAVATGTGNDEVRIAQSPLFTVDNNGPITLDDGDDILNTYYNADFQLAQFDGGDGDDRLLIGGAYSIHTVGVAGVNVGNTSAAVTYTADLGADVVGFETIVVNSAEAATATTPGNTINFEVIVSDDNVDAADGLVVDASGLTADVVTDLGGDGALGGGDDITSDNTLTFDGSALSGNREVTVLGGAGGDDITGGDGNDVLSGGAGEDTINGGLGADMIDLDDGGTQARDTVIVDAGAASRTAPDTITGFQIDSDNGTGANAGLSATADVIDFGAGLINENNVAISDGFVQDGTALQVGIDRSSSLLAAIQLVEQEFQSDAVVNNGVVGFVYEGDTYIGEITGPQGAESFTDLVRLTGVTGAEGLVVDGGAVGLVVNP